MLDESLSRCQHSPQMLICASGMGDCPSSGDKVLTEDWPARTRFVARLQQEGESATAPANEAGIRVVHLRIPPVLPLYRRYWLAFAFLRSFPLSSLLVLFVSSGLCYWNHSNKLGQQLAATSYNIYLVRLFIVVALQMAFLGRVGGPVLIKIAIVFLVSLALSFGISRWILARHARAFTLVILGLFVFCLFVRP